MGLLLALGLAGAPRLEAQAPEAPRGRVLLGFTGERYTGGDTLKEWSLGMELFLDDRGPWMASVATLDAPGGRGTYWKVGKEIGFGAASWVWIGAGAGSRSDFLPRTRGEVEAHLSPGGPWGLGVLATWSRYADSEQVWIYQAGPTWSGEAWQVQARWQLARPDPGGSLSGGLLELRWGPQRLRRWHSLLLGAGEGLLDSQQPGSAMIQPVSTAAASLVLQGGPGGSGGGTGSGPGRRGRIEPAATAGRELLVSSAHHMPIGGGFSLRLDLGWGQRQGEFSLWTAGLQIIRTF